MSKRGARIATMSTLGLGIAAGLSYLIMADGPTIPPGATRLTDAQMRRFVGGNLQPKCRFGCARYGFAKPAGLGSPDGAPPIINPTTAEVNDQLSPLSVSTAAGGLTIDLAYNSSLADGSNTILDCGLGVGWTHSLNIMLLKRGNDFLWLGGDGEIARLNQRRGGYEHSTGQVMSIDVTGASTAAVTMPNGTRYDFREGSPPFELPGLPYLLERIVDRNGLITAFAYTGEQLTSVTDAFGNQLSLEHGGPGNRLSRITDLMGREARLEYHPTDLTLTAVVLPGGARIEYTYNFRRQLTAKTVPGPLTWRVDYNPDGKAFRMRDHAGAVLIDMTSDAGWAMDIFMGTQTGEMHYTPGTTTLTDGLGNQRTYTYDDRGFLIEEHLPCNPPGVSTIYTYDSNQLRPTTTTDANGHTTTYEYDQHGNLTLIGDHLGNETRMFYEHPTIPSLQTRKIEPDGDEWTFEYDANGNLTREIDPLVEVPVDAVITHTYDSNGLRTSSTDRNGHVTAWQYDAAGRMTNQTRDPGGLEITTLYQFDSVGRRTSETDDCGVTRTTLYDDRGHQTGRIVDPGGLDLVTTTEYDGRGNVSAEINPRGCRTEYEYDHRDRRTLATDCLGFTTSYTYDAVNNLLTTTDANNNTTESQYDSCGRVTRRIDATGHAIGYEYDPVGNRTAVIDENGHQTETEYDELDRALRRTVDPGGLDLITEYRYTPPTGGGGGGCCGAGTPGTGLLACTTDPEGKVTRYEYDVLDRRTKVIRQFGTQDCDAAEDSDDAVTVTEYDPVGNVRTTTIENDPDPDTIVRFEYDAANRTTTEVRDPGGADLTTRHTYGCGSRQVEILQTNGNQVTRTYDVAERVVAVTDSEGPLVTYTYDDNGNVLTERDGNGNGPTYEYDLLDRRTRATDALGSPTSFFYDNLSNVTRVNDRKGRDTLYGYDAVYRRTSITSPLTDPLPTVRFEYDGVGNMTSLVDALGRTTSFEYDAADRMVREVYPDDAPPGAGVRRFEYDGSGNKILRVDQRGNETHYEYDDLHRLIQRSHVDTSGDVLPTPTDTYTYDRAGRRLSADNANATLEFHYDGAGRLTRTIQDVLEVQYDYTIDASNNRRQLTYPGGLVVREDYDRRDRLEFVRDAADQIVAQMQYDAGDRMTARDYAANGTSAEFSYDANDWVSRITHSNAGGPFVDLQYGRDAEGNATFLKKHHDLNNSELYASDSADRLVDFQRGLLSSGHDAIDTPTSNPGWKQRQEWTNLDDLGNWLEHIITLGGAPTTESRVANEVNEYTDVGGTAQGHDDTGNLTDDGSNTYAWDIENRLGRVLRIAPAETLGDYAYDALDRRVRKEAGAQTVVYVYDDRWRVLEERDGGGALNADYILGNGDDEVLVMHRGGEALYYHADDIDSTVALTDNAADVAERYAYDAYGTTYVEVPPSPLFGDADGDGDADLADYALLQRCFTGAGQGLLSDGCEAADADGDDDVDLGDFAALQEAMEGSAPSAPADRAASSVGNPYLFTGHRLDDETGLYHYRLRHYDTGRGRLLSRDPAADLLDGPERVNLYNYVLNNPINLVDPTGGCGAPACTKKCEVKSGPTYNPTGTITPTKTGTRLSASFTLSAEFHDKPEKGWVCSCCWVQQNIQWNDKSLTPLHGGFPATLKADTWHEDRDSGDKRYGHRAGKHSESIASNHYEDSSGKHDLANGCKYVGSDGPGGDETAFGVGETWKFQLKVIDKCNGDKEVGSTEVITIKWR